jgi:serine/threonine-protein kinase
MLGKYGETLVVDWGLAKVIGHDEGLAGSEEGTLRPFSAADTAPTQTGDVMGTPAYMSPEQAAGQLDRLGPASDIYSLGATLYVLLTGTEPVHGQHVGEILTKVKRGDWLPPRNVRKDVPAALNAICCKALALMPQKRYVSALQLAADIEHWLADEPVTAYREPWAARLRRWRRRHRPLVAGTAALLLTAALALTFRVFEKQRAESALAATAEAKRRTRHALDAMSSNVMEKLLFRQGLKLDPALEEFLKGSLNYYREFAQEAGDSPEIRQGVANAHWRVGDICRKLGRQQEAMNAYHAAIEVGERLAADFPMEPEYRQDVARSYYKLGILLRDLSKHAEAESAYREALKIQAQLAADFPTMPEYRQDIARTYYDLGILLHNLRKHEKAEAAYRDALKIQTQLIADFPTVPEYRQDVAASHYNLGILLHDRGKRAEAEAAYHDALKGRERLAEAEIAFRDALKGRERLATDFPAVPQYRQDVARSYYNLGILLRDLGKPKEAEAAYHDALNIQAQLSAEFPEVPRYRQELAASRNSLGDLLRDRGKRSEAETAYRDALKIQAQLAADSPTVPDYQNELAGTMVTLANLLRRSNAPGAARQLLEQAVPHHEAVLKVDPDNLVYRQFFRNNRQSLAEVLVELREHAAAAETATQLVQAAIDPQNDVYHAARSLARCVPLAERDTRLSDAQRKERAQTYANRAMTTLRQAVQNGYQDTAHMKKDKGLDPLRSRPDFQKLLQQLAEKNK